MGKRDQDEMTRAIDVLAKPMPNGQLMAALGPLAFLGSAAEHIKSLSVDLSASQAAVTRLTADNTEAAKLLARAGGEVERLRGELAASVDETDWAAVQISRCPNCDEFPCEWNSMGMPCSECGVELMSDVAVGEDGSALWTFDFADQADYERKRAAAIPRETKEPA